MVAACQDVKDKKMVAVKVSKNKKFDVDNANVEIKLLNKLSSGPLQEGEDIEGRNCIVKILDNFKFR